MTVYQTEGGFTCCKDEQELDKESGAADAPSSSLRSQWFLSTNQRLGFIPLHISDTCSEEASGNEDDVADVMSPTFSQSLEKMQQNTSLFYKIACDISISDSDINKNDGNASAGREDGGEQLEEEETGEPGGKPAADLEILQEEQEVLRQLKVQEPNSSTCEEAEERAQTQDGDSETTEPEETGVGPEKCAEVKKSSGSCQGQERGDTCSLYGGGRVPRSASLGKARVTVFRTSL